MSASDSDERYPPGDFDPAAGFATRGEAALAGGWRPGQARAFAVVATGADTCIVELATNVEPDVRPWFQECVRRHGRWYEGWAGWGS